jgi:nucleoid DNA-binding protein
MTLNKSDLIRSVMQNVRFPKKVKGPQRFLFPEMEQVSMGRDRASELVNGLFEQIISTLVEGEDVSIRGFGRFQVKFKWARKGRNPQTGEMIILRSMRRVRFKCSQKLREKVNLAP